jgi:hypothetical protein
MTRRVPKSLTGPIKVERQDQDDGSITYEVMDWGTGTYHCLCHVSTDYNDNAKQEAEFIALALNNAIGALTAIDEAEYKQAITGRMSPTS